MAIDICIPLGRRIRALRLKRGWMQVDLAVNAGLTRETISNIELAKKEAGIRALQKIAQAFSMTTAQLLGGLERYKDATCRIQKRLKSSDSPFAP